MTVRTTDNGAKNLLRQAKALARRKGVRVGIIGDEAGSDHGGGLTVAEVAEFHEFGLGVPRRSFIADYVDENRKEIETRLKATMKGILRGDLTIKQSLELIGVKTVAEMQERISNSIPPELDEKTVARKTVNGKKGDVPLIDTGQLRSSITYDVVGV